MTDKKPNTYHRSPLEEAQVNNIDETHKDYTGRTDKDMREHTHYIHSRADYKRVTGGHQKRAGNSLNGRKQHMSQEGKTSK